MLPTLLLAACAVPTDTNPREPDSGVRYDIDGDGYFQDEECDDNDPESHPGGIEICDSKDNDCNGRYDDDAKNATVVYADADGDGYAPDDAKGMAVCELQKGLTTERGDCDDANLAIHPDAEELCGDGIDNDCADGDAAC
jgi:type IV pilus assembly protein PilY1